MKFVLEIKCDNAAFADWPENEVARILRELSKKLEEDGLPFATLYDYNGNNVGFAEFKE